jgi:hypothetical protein
MIAASTPESPLSKLASTNALPTVTACTIALVLNSSKALSPRAQRGRPNGWSSSSVRAVVTRDAYCGIVVYGRRVVAFAYLHLTSADTQVTPLFDSMEFWGPAETVMPVPDSVQSIYRVFEGGRRYTLRGPQLRHSGGSAGAVDEVHPADDGRGARDQPRDVLVEGGNPPGHGRAVRGA